MSSAAFTSGTDAFCADHPLINGPVDVAEQIRSAARQTVAEWVQRHDGHDIDALAHIFDTLGLR